LSSKNLDVGDPVLCKVSHVELYGRSVFPYGSYLVGRFEDFSDPGHFVGKGWMELKFDRMILPPDTVIPIAAKVVDVPKFPVDKQGRIHGKGHPVRDIVEWSIPVLWPIDLLNLPRRGPRPTLKAETRLTLKVMDDMGVPMREETAHASSGLNPRSPVSYAEPAPMAQEPAPMVAAAAPPVFTPAPTEMPAPRPVAYSYAPQPPAPTPVYQVPPPVTLLVMRNGYGMYATNYWLDGRGTVRYTAVNGAPVVMPVDQLDLATTVSVNRQRGVPFNLQTAAY
jgi:hypothetical protein